MKLSNAEDNFERGFLPLTADSISSEGANIRFLILQQIDRLNYLFSFKMASAVDNIQRQNVQIAVETTLRSLESLLNPILDESYFVPAKELKANLQRKRFETVRVGWSVNITRTETEKRKRIHKPYGLRRVPLVFSDSSLHLVVCCEWFDLITKNLRNVGLLPSKKEDYIFDFGEKND